MNSPKPVYFRVPPRIVLMARMWVLCALVGGVGWAVAVRYDMDKRRRIAATGQPATALVTSTDASRISGDGQPRQNRKLYKLQLEYRVEGVTYRPEMYVSQTAYHAALKALPVAILYDPGDPSAMVLSDYPDTGLDNYIGPGILGVLGVLWGGLVFFSPLRRGKSERPEQ